MSKNDCWTYNLRKNPINAQKNLSDGLAWSCIGTLASHINFSKATRIFDKIFRNHSIYEKNYVECESWDFKKYKNYNFKFEELLKLEICKPKLGWRYFFKLVRHWKIAGKTDVETVLLIMRGNHFYF